MQFVQFRWVFCWYESNPPRGAIHIGSGAQLYYQILQYRERRNIDEIGLQEPIWSEWYNV